MRAQVSTHVTLLNRLIDGADHSAWHDFQSRYGELIRGYARRCGLQCQDCDDILQDVLISLTRAMPQFIYDPARGRFRSFLKTIAVRAVSRKFRQKQPRTDLDMDKAQSVEDAETDETEAMWESEWRQYHIRWAMQTIDVEFNDTDRLAFRHYVIGNKEPAATAELLGITVNQVYKAKSNILKRLNQLIAQQVLEEG